MTTENEAVSALIKDKRFVQAAELADKCLPRRSLEHPDTETRRGMFHGIVKAAIDANDAASAVQMLKRFPEDLGAESIDAIVKCFLGVVQKHADSRRFRPRG